MLMQPLPEFLTGEKMLLVVGEVEAIARAGGYQRGFAAAENVWSPR